MKQEESLSLIPSGAKASIVSLALLKIIIYIN